MHNMKVASYSTHGDLQALSMTAPQRLQRVEGWGMAHVANCYVVQPSTVGQVEDIFKEAKAKGQKVALRGGGQSYGDASIGQESILLDCSKLNRVLAWDGETGIIDVEPGVTIEDLWQYVVADGWWPPVVSGTMRPTLAGAAAMNIHGKNNYKMGPIGDHILEFEMLTPEGKKILCSREENPRLFHAMISSFGVLGFFTRIRLQMKKVYSGELEVHVDIAPSLKATVDYFEEHLHNDYLVGWVDGTAKGRNRGRCVIHKARYLEPGEDPNPHKTLTATYQDIPKMMFGVVPKSILWVGLWMLKNRPSWTALNTSKFHFDRLHSSQPPFRQSHAAFHFLLDHVPNWKRGYRPGGLIQYQSFVPKEHSAYVFDKQLEMSQEAGLPPFLAVFKKHRPDPFLMTHALDGHSFALDYPVTKKNRERLIRLTEEMTELVIAHGGRFYFAKDGVLRKEDVHRAFPKESLDELYALKKELDPEHVLQTDLSRRLFDF